LFSDGFLREWQTEAGDRERLAMEGQVIGGYRLLSEIGSGGMATVYLAERDGARVALKLLHKHLIDQGNFGARFLREAEVGVRIRHPNVVRTLDFGISDEEGGDDYLVMEYVEGQTLREMLEEMGRLPESLCRHIAREITHALVAIHTAGIIHRDLKPENIIVTRDEVVKVMDLGVAFLADEAIRLSLTGQFVGSIFYAAPEQIQGGGKDIDPRVDLYQLGVVLYELISGRHPYRAADMREALRRLLTEEPHRVSEWNPRVSPFLEEVVHTLLEKRRDRRFSSSATLLRVLRAEETSEWWRQREEKIRSRSALRRVRVAKETALYGRAGELDLARDLFERVRSGAGQTLLVTGEAGIGKSRILDEIERTLGEEAGPVTVLVGGYRRGATATTDGAFSCAYREHLGVEGLPDRLAALELESPRLIPAFVALLTGEDLPAGEAPLTPESLPLAFVQVTRALAREQPVLLLIDDLSEAPEEGLALFAALSVALAGDPVFLVGASRPDLPEDWVAQLERREHVRCRELDRLTDEDLRLLLTDALGSDRLADALHDRIAVKSDGKPFYVFEILKGLREGQFIGEGADGTWVTTREIRSLSVPSTVKDLVTGRLEGLDETDLDILGAASCMGFGFEPGLIARAIGVGRIPLLKRLGRLEKSRRIVRSVGRKYTFDDHQIQEAIYEGLGPDRRRELHAALARAMEERVDPAGAKGEIAVRLCHHFLLGDRPEKAEKFLDAAVNHLAAGYLNGKAVEMLDRALEFPDLLSGKARVEALLRKAHHLDLLGWPDDERAALDEAVARADEVGDAKLRAKARRMCGTHLRTCSRYQDARRYLTEAVEIARVAEDPGEEAAATGELGLVCWHLADYAEASRHHDRARELFLGTGDTVAASLCEGRLGLVEFAHGMYDSAQRRIEELLEVARSTGDTRGQALNEGHLASVLGARGRYAEAIERMEEALAISRRIGDRQGEGFGYLGLGMLHPRVGRPRPGRQLLEEARAAFRQVGFREGEAAATHGIGMLVEDAGRPEEASALYRQSLAHRREIGDRRGMAESLLRLGRLAGREKRFGEATGDLVVALGIANEIDEPETRVLAASYLALFARGDADHAAKLLAEDEERLSHTARIEAHLALYRATEEIRHLETARTLLGELLRHAPEDCQDLMRKRVPLYRDVLAAN
jgi:tetratricopeptide (TPR) repeat protein